MYVIIPAKPLDQSKTRLSPVLSPHQRADLSRHLLVRTIRLAGRVGKVVVITRDKAVRKLAKQAGAWALVEASTGLNKAIRQASEWVKTRDAQATLILPADLPLLTVADLVEIVALGRQAPAVVIAPCQRTKGTNALLLRPPGLIEFTFGPGSFEKHRQATQIAGFEPLIYQSATIALDLDYPEDLEQVLLEYHLIEPGPDFASVS